MSAHLEQPQPGSGPVPVPRRMAQRSVAGLLAGLSAVVLAGCTGLGAPDVPADERPSASAAEPSREPGVISPKLTRVPSLKGSAGVVKDAKLTDCSTKPGKVAAKGTVTNTAKKTKDIVVVISWVTPTSDVVARGVTAVKDLEAGKSAEWSTDSTLTFDGSAQCVMTVNAGDLQA